MKQAWLWLAGCLLSGSAAAQNASVTVTIDVALNRHPIQPTIYGVAFASTADLKTLHASLNRSGGNNMSTYSYANNAQNLDADYFFESYPQGSAVPGAEADVFVADTRAGNAQPLLTVPLIGWVAKLGPNQSILPSFSVKKYGSQCAADPYDSDAGDGLLTDCSTAVTGNDPNDAYVPDSLSLEQAWIDHLVATWGRSNQGGVRYYLMDNEPSIWFSTHRDIHPVGPHANEYSAKVTAASAMVKSQDPSALIFGPEEWGWEGYFYSGYDQQSLSQNGTAPDHAGIQGGLDYIPWLLTQWKAARAIDVLSVHFYPQGADGSDDDSEATQLLRNRSTRQLWDPHYVSESWIDQPVYLIPRLKSWIADYYVPGTKVAITEYNWGDETHINGATAQADILGIFGREGLDFATRWTVPAANTPTYKAMQLYRNYDGAHSGFGDTSVLAAVPDPDTLAAFAAQRGRTGALTVMVIAKGLTGTNPVNLSIRHFAQNGPAAQRWQLTAANTIRRLSNIPWKSGVLADTVPAQSITLYVLPNK
jgi:hypothetical protein